MNLTPSLRQQKFFFVDCQTTGTSPANGQIIDLAWSYASADDMNPEIHSMLLALPEGRTIPPVTTEITGLTNEDMLKARPAIEVRDLFLQALESAKADSSQFGHDFASLIHYAQFEKIFLKPFLADEKENSLFEIFCTSKLSKKLVPALPNFNIRGVAGYYGMPYHELKRATDHVRATLLIWKGLCEELEKKELTTLDHIRSLLGEKKKPAAKPKFEFRITREFRLSLPDKPGIYKMKDKSGNILYVGKATSLYDRVNSYFRGQANRDKRKLQMLAQTWEMEVQECASALEAAVRETDEIKKWDPPYNVSLKAGRRDLCFYNRALDHVSLTQDEEHALGPFALSNSIEEVKWLIDWREGRGALTRIFYGIYEHDELEAGYKTFLDRHPLNFSEMSLRDHIAFGYQLWRQDRAIEDIQNEDVTGAENETETEEVLTPDDIADKFERVYMRAAKTLHRARAITRLMNADLGWEENSSAYTLKVRNGYLLSKDASDKKIPNQTPWADRTLADYDRMSVLLSEITNRAGHIRHI